jgi:phage repressor protein C with HTH and peptisase S24 domain
MGVPTSTYLAHENGQNDFGPEDAKLYGSRLGVSPAWLLLTSGSAEVVPPDAPPLPPPNARIGLPIDLTSTSERIPVYGQAVGGQDGRFIFNGEKIADVLAPPILWGVRDAYAVYVVGESMEPRYLAGETVYVNPHIPTRRGEFVVVQIKAGDGEAPYGYIKQFVSMSADKLRLKQFNPEKDLSFPTRLVFSVHKIVQAG